MISKLVGVATLFAAGSILVAGTPTLGAKALDTQATATSHLRCGGGGGGGRRCGGRRCGGGGGWPVPSCASRRCGHVNR